MHTLSKDESALVVYLIEQSRAWPEDVRVLAKEELEAADALHRKLRSDMTTTPDNSTAPTPFAYYVYVPAEQRGEFVHALDDACDDLTNCECEVTRLYAAPVPAVQAQAAAPAVQVGAGDADALLQDMVLIVAALQHSTPGMAHYPEPVARHAAALAAAQRIADRTALDAARGAAPAPAGMVLVPERPTDAMMQAGLYQSSADTEWAGLYSAYVDMIAARPDAAPASPAPGDAPMPAEQAALLWDAFAERVRQQAGVEKLVNLLGAEKGYRTLFLRVAAERAPGDIGTAPATAPAVRVPSDAELDAVLTKVVGDSGVYHAEWLAETGRPCARAVLARWGATQAAPPAAQQEPAQPLIARALAEWHEEDGSVSWWAWNGREWAGEPAWIGTPNCDDWPGYHTHWTAHPAIPAGPATQVTKGTGEQL